ncbi:MAG: FtsX-like permease family protein [Desulfobacula sp.]|nr:FtsX-like permease family protein [Desulfobacula sp.]
MLFWIKTAALFLIRSRRTSIVLTLMVIIAVASLIFLSSLAMGVNDAMIRNSVGLFSGHIAIHNIPDNIKKADLAVKGVVSVLQRVPIAGFVQFKDKIDKMVLVGVDPEQERKTSAFWKKVTKGRFIKKGSSEIFIGEPVSIRLGAKCGDLISFSLKPGSEKRQFLIAGIYKTGISQLDTGIAFCDIEIIKNSRLENNAKNNQYFWNGAVFINDGIDMEMVLQQLHNKIGHHVNVQTWKQLMPDLEQLISLNYFSMSIVIVIVFIIVSLGITSAFSIFILKNIREYGIMKVMGVTSTQTITLLCWEVFLINIAASLFGVIFGIFIVSVFQKTGIDLTAWTSHNQYFIVSGVIFPRLTAYSLFLPPVFALVFSLPAAIWPAIMISGKTAAEILSGTG